MGEYAKELERHIEERRHRLNDNIGELEQKALDVLDWRAQVEHRPATMLGLAFGAGMVLAAVVGRSRHETEYDSSGLEPEVYDRRRAEYSPEPAVRAWDKIKDALVAAALAQVENVVQEVLPDFSLQEPQKEPRHGRSETGPASQRVH
jgi:hypothetical protein